MHAAFSFMSFLQNPLSSSSLAIFAPGHPSPKPFDLTVKAQSDLSLLLTPNILPGHPAPGLYWLQGTATSVIEVGPLGKGKGEPGISVSAPVMGSIA